MKFPICIIKHKPDPSLSPDRHLSVGFMVFSTSRYVRICSHMTVDAESNLSYINVRDIYSDDICRLQLLPAEYAITIGEDGRR